MPRTRLDRYSKPAPITLPPENKLETTMRRYMRAQHMTATSISQQLGCSPQNVGYMLKRPAELWSAADVRRYAKAMNMPLDVAFTALAESIEASL